MADTVSLRVAHESDADAIRDLTRTAYAKWVKVLGREPLPMTVDYREAVKRNRFDLLYQDGRLAALIETAPDGETLLIENVAVLPEFQGRGFGKRLLKHSEDLAVSMGLPKTRLYTNKLMTTNLRLYEAEGYQVDREERFSHGVAVHMSKDCGPRLADRPG